MNRVFHSWRWAWAREEKRSTLCAVPSLEFIDSLSYSNNYKNTSERAWTTERNSLYIHLVQQHTEHDTLKLRVKSGASATHTFCVHKYGLLCTLYSRTVYNSAQYTVQYCIIILGMSEMWLFLSMWYMCIVLCEWIILFVTTYELNALQNCTHNETDYFVFVGFFYNLLAYSLYLSLFLSLFLFLDFSSFYYSLAWPACLLPSSAHWLWSILMSYILHRFLFLFFLYK